MEEDEAEGPRRFSWHVEKAEKVFRDRRIDFQDMLRVFDGPRLEFRSDRNEEERWVTIGKVEGRLFAVVFTIRGDVTWIITARRARTNEERAYRLRFRGQREGGQDGLEPR